MGPVVTHFALRRTGAAAAALTAGLLVTGLAACGGGPPVGPSAGHPIPTGNPIPAFTPAPAAAPVPSACSLLRSADVLAVAATFRDTTITIDGHSQDSQSPLNQCGYKQKGVFVTNGITVTLSGDMWATLNVIANGNNIGDWSPADGPAIHGLGNGAYWDPGSDTVVVLVGQNVLQVVDDVPVNNDAYPDLPATRQKAATALAAKILGHMAG
jgi:hypothetical protein